LGLASLRSSVIYFVVANNWEEDIMLSETSIKNFKASLRGDLIQRSDERYEEARKLYNG
jgi:hypothetical protein